MLTSHISEQKHDYYEVSECLLKMRQSSEKSYKMASDNTKYNAAGKAVILENDEWRDEKEWDEVFGLMQNEQKNP